MQHPSFAFSLQRGPALRHASHLSRQGNRGLGVAGFNLIPCNSIFGLNDTHSVSFLMPLLVKILAELDAAILDVTTNELELGKLREIQKRLASQRVEAEKEAPPKDQNVGTLF